MTTLRLISAEDAAIPASANNTLQLANDADPLALAGKLDGVNRIELNFPKFTDGRAFSQAYLLRRRLGFAGDIRATGDVVLDTLLQMQRSGFTEAVLRADQDIVHGARLLNQFGAFYQGDAVHPKPAFVAA
jgi:uncharacterized protein (DUF934 family)